MVCPYLEYSDENDGVTFAEPRAYCTVVDEFVQPMRADVCNDRYELSHEHHCEIFRQHVSGDDE
ncbi:hypothetical protein [Haladaptatus sp. NG-WS-4]